MKKKKSGTLLVEEFGSEGGISYKVKSSPDSIKLIRHGSHWASGCRGEEAARLENDGNGITFSRHGALSVRMDYLVYHELRILMAAERRHHKKKFPKSGFKLWEAK